MNSFSFSLRLLSRDLRGGELTVLLVAVILAVASMTAVGFFTDRVAKAIRAQANAVLAADLVLETAESLSFPTMVLAGEQSALAFITAVSDGYPLRGELLISEQMFAENRAATGIPEPGTAWAEPGLLGRMGIQVGDRVEIGDQELRITTVLEYQPGRSIGGFSNLAPGLMVNLADVPEFNVIKPGSRVTYRQLFAGSPADISKFRADLGQRVGPGTRLQGLEDAGEQINAAIDRAQRFLTLASLVTVILAAVATAMASRRYALRHLDTVALMKSFGASQALVQRSTLIQLAALIAGTAVAGSLAGYAAQSVLVYLAGDLLKISLPAATPTAASLGLLTAATITIGFSLPHLLQLGNTTPLRVLRHDLPPPPLRAGVTYGVAITALLLMIYAIVRELMLVGLIAAGLALVTIASVAVGWLLVRVLTRFRGAAGVAWRYGLANISRRGGESVVQIVAFALGLMVLLLLTLVRNDLLSEWERTLPADAPNYFLINIEPTSWPAMDEFIRAEFGTEPDFLPFIRGRITAIKGVPVDELTSADIRGANFLRQEANLTWSADLPESNELLAGEWWAEGTGGAIKASLEMSIASSLGVGIGDTISFDVGGELFDAPVTSLRFVEWDSMTPNFYVMLSPGLAQELPQTYVASMHVPAEQRMKLSRFVRAFPGVTLLDLEVILDQVEMVIERASMAVQYVFLFTLLAGVVVMLAAIQVTRDERRFESAILHTLGASRRKILQGVAVEFTALGGLAGLLAALGATGIGYQLAERVFKLQYPISPNLWLAGLLVGAAVVGVTGTLATRRAVSEPPVTVLREA
jgi:putative ABC transport system permease protein